MSIRSLTGLLLAAALVALGAAAPPPAAAGVTALPQWPAAECASGALEKITGSFVKGRDNTNLAALTISGYATAGCLEPADSVWAITQFHHRYDGFTEDVMGKPWISRANGDGRFTITGRIAAPSLICLSYGLKESRGVVRSTITSCAYIFAHPANEMTPKISTPPDSQSDGLSRWPDLTSISESRCTDCLYTSPGALPASPAPPLPGAPPADVDIWPYPRDCANATIWQAFLARPAAGGWAGLTVAGSSGACNPWKRQGTVAATVYFDGSRQPGALKQDYGAMSLPWSVTGYLLQPFSARTRVPAGVTAVCVSAGLDRRADGVYARNLACAQPNDASRAKAAPKPISVKDPRVQKRLDYWPSPGVDAASYCARCLTVTPARPARPATPVAAQVWPARTPPRAFETSRDWVRPRPCTIAAITAVTSDPVTAWGAVPPVTVTAATRACPGTTLPPGTGYYFTVYDDTGGSINNKRESYNATPAPPTPTRTGLIGSHARAVCVTNGLDWVEKTTEFGLEWDTWSYNEACAAVSRDADGRLSWRPLPVDDEVVSRKLRTMPPMLGPGPVRPCLNCM